MAERASQRAHELSNGSAALQSAVSRTSILFFVIRPTDGTTNPNVMGIAEDIALAFNVRTPTQYLMASVKLGEKSSLSYDDHVTTERINGVEFGWLEAVSRNPNSSVRQRYYATLRRHHAISFVITYHNDQELKWGLEVLQSVKFESDVPKR